MHRDNYLPFFTGRDAEFRVEVIHVIKQQMLLSSSHFLTPRLHFPLVCAGDTLAFSICSTMAWFSAVCMTVSNGLCSGTFGWMNRRGVRKARHLHSKDVTNGGILGRWPVSLMELLCRVPNKTKQWFSIHKGTDVNFIRHFLLNELDIHFLSCMHKYFENFE